MVGISQDRVLVIGDADSHFRSIVAQALPGSEVTSVPNVFEGIVELSLRPCRLVLAPIEPIERRAESALAALRDIAGDARIMLFGHPALEPECRRLLDSGGDDYLVTPATAADLNAALAAPPRPALPRRPIITAMPEDAAGLAGATSALPSGTVLLNVMLEALLRSPGTARDDAIGQINLALTDGSHVSFIPAAARGENGTPAASVSSLTLTQELADRSGVLRMDVPVGADPAAAGRFLVEIATALASVALLDQRHVNLQRLAITDELTGAHNARYFRHFLTQIIDRARAQRFLVTLFLFDIDDFKSYNDRFGHGAGDEILRQTTALIRRCTRDHDLVARIGGDEFAVVFWEKDAPRQPHAGHSSSQQRVPQEPMQILDRFRRLLASEQFNNLGPGARGSLTISGGVAVYPWDAQNVAGLIECADRKLVFGAKREGKNAIHLVGGDTLAQPSGEPPT